MHSYQVKEKGKPLLEAKKALILLHGRGADADNILPLADAFCDDSFYIVAPQATNNEWYPFTFLSPEERNEPWLTSAVTMIKRLIDGIAVQIPSNRIYIMGFSQGACLALEVAAQYAIKYAGIAAFSGGLIGEKIRPEKYQGNFDGTKVFIGNSDNDPHIPVLRCEESRDLMKKLGAEVTLNIYPGMSHTITPKEIEDVLKLMF
jgi:phospholipase/carboxylesterase